LLGVTKRCGYNSGIKKKKELMGGVVYIINGGNSNGYTSINNTKK